MAIVVAERHTDVDFLRKCGCLESQRFCDTKPIKIRSDDDLYLQ